MPRSQATSECPCSGCRAPPAPSLVLSSYQAQSLTVSPDVVVLTALFPNTSTGMESQQQYYDDKLNILAHERTG